ncbi:MAG: 50S ribosomal protein L18e [Aigarchaeota archaeon]|nr:50S ribosomal protein L18e [Aigarchaeota archaeon]MCX8193186.1 50S ribosomal protein L18e [Nitrososphaeria archaeon]MDW7986327.1 50S ribosomal protein L18e [Nitrososphaerota archaeon]
MVGRRKIVKPGFKQMILSQIPRSVKKNRFWRRVVEEVQKSRRSKRVVNLYKLDKLTNSGDVVYVIGKVLGVGELTHPITISAFSFSKTAYEKIRRVGGTILTTAEFAERYPTGSNVRLIG